jgi:hypothetical protein
MFSIIFLSCCTNGNYEKWHGKSANRDNFNGIIFYALSFSSLCLKINHRQRDRSTSKMHCAEYLIKIPIAPSCTPLSMLLNIFQLKKQKKELFEIEVQVVVTIRSVKCLLAS